MPNSIPVKVQIQRVQDATERSLPVFAAMDATLARLRKRAYELSEARGFASGYELDDWLAAERELCAPVNVIEEPTGFRVAVDLRAVDSDEVEVTATPTEILVHARPRTAPQRRHAKVTLLSERPLPDTYAHLRLRTPICVDEVRVSALAGQLTIIAPKAASGDVDRDTSSG